MEKQETESAGLFDGIRTNNPCGFIARENISEATGGLISKGRAANLDSIGEGIKGRFRVGRKVAYPVDRVVEFLESWTKILDPA